MSTTGPPGRTPARWRRAFAALAIGGLTLGIGASLPGGAAAQGATPDLNALAIDWLGGTWMVPLLCEIADQPVRGARRLRIGPDPRRTYEIVGRLEVRELKADGAERCFDDMGRDEPDVRGRIYFKLDGPSRPDWAMRDFEQILKREGGFDFRIESGRLQLRSLADADAAPRTVDFAGGELRVRRIAKGSDAARLLAEFPTPRKVTYEIRARDGTALRWNAVAP